MNKVADRPSLPGVVPRTVPGLFDFSATLVQQLLRWTQEVGYRLNGVLPEDGSERMTKPLPLKEYGTAGSLPDAAAWTSALAIVTTGDTADPAGLYRSDGSTWTRIG